MLKNAVAGNYDQKVEYDLDTPSGQVQFRNYSLVGMAEEKHKCEAGDAVGELDANHGTKCSYIQTADLEMTLDGICGAIANHLSIGEAQYICTTPSKIPLW